MTESSVEILRPLLRKFSVPTAEAAMSIAIRKLRERCGIAAPPVPLAGIQEFLDVRLTRNSGVASATLRTSSSGLEVMLGDDSANWRSDRFQLAHELAHVLLFYLLNDNAAAFRYGIDSPEYKQIESLCNTSARELLVPVDYLLYAIQNQKFIDRGLDFLRDEFLVSKEVLQYQLPAALPGSTMLVWERSKRKEDHCKVHRVSSVVWRKHYKRAPAWLAEGCSVRHLDRDIVGESLEHMTPVVTPKLRITLNKQVKECFAIAFPMSSSMPVQLSLFEDDRQATPPARDTVLMFCGTVGSASERDIWNTWIRMAG